MERVNCPLCQSQVTVASDRPAWFELTPEPVILAHSPGPAAVLNRRDVRHIGSVMCLASGCSVALARGIAADRAEGRHLLAHP
jgi:hypothetical protein